MSLLFAMLALETWKPALPIAGLLTDIDDTLTTDGAVPAQVVTAIAALKA